MHFKCKWQFELFFCNNTICTRWSHDTLSYLLFDNLHMYCSCCIYIYIYIVIVALCRRDELPNHTNFQSFHALHFFYFIVVIFHSRWRSMFWFQMTDDLDWTHCNRMNWWWRIVQCWMKLKIIQTHTHTHRVCSNEVSIILIQIICSIYVMYAIHRISS